MKKLLLVLTPLLLLILTGCGGSGSSVSAGRSRESLAQWVKSAMAAYSANAGMEAISGMSRLPSGRDGGIGSGGGDGGGPYFDDWLGLWAVSTWTDTTFTTDYFLDEALTQPAGSSFSTWTSTETESSGSTTVDITAGPSQGYKVRSDYTFSAVTMAGSYSSRVEHPEFGASEDTGVWNADGSGSYQSSWRKGSDFFEHQGSWQADGSWTSSSSGSNGYGLTMQGNADGSGSGTITGPDALLPATIVWNAAGEGVITWADGSTTLFSWFGIAGDPGTGGGSDGGGDGSGGGAGGM